MSADNEKHLPAHIARHYTKNQKIDRRPFDSPITGKMKTEYCRKDEGIDEVDEIVKKMEELWEKG